MSVQRRCGDADNCKVLQFSTLHWISTKALGQLVYHPTVSEPTPVVVVLILAVHHHHHVFCVYYNANVPQR